MKGDEEKAMAAGCDGYIPKPIDTRALPGQVRHYLMKRPAVETEPPPAKAEPYPAPAIGITTLDDLRKRFLAEGGAEARRLLRGSDSAEVQRAVHQWIGAAALLGLSEISALASQTDALLRAGDGAAVRGNLEALARAFETPHPPVVA
jgi:CheY-like chemotaxis protein